MVENSSGLKLGKRLVSEYRWVWTSVTRLTRGKRSYTGVFRVLPQIVQKNENVLIKETIVSRHGGIGEGHIMEP